MVASFSSRFTRGRFNAGRFGAVAAAALPLITQPEPAAGSADFTEGLDAGWTTVPGTLDPGFDGFSVVDGRLQVAFPDDWSGDPGTGNNTAGLAVPRVETSIADTDFDLFTKLDTDFLKQEADYTGSGFILRGSGTSARIDFYVAGAAREVSGFIKFGTQTATFTRPAPPGEGNGTQKGLPLHNHLRRRGDVFTWFMSYDGSTWTQVAQFTWAVALTHAGVHFYQINASVPAGFTGCTFALDYAHLESQTPPLLAASVSRSPLLVETFDDLASWTDASENGGSAVAAGNVLTLSATATDRSTGRIASLQDYAEDQGMLFAVTSEAGSTQEIYLGAVLRGQSLDGLDWAGQYTPPLALVWEGNAYTNLVRVLRAGGPSDAFDGAKWTYFDARTIEGIYRTDKKWVRMEAVGPFFRYRIWDDAVPEPSAWEVTVLDGAVRGPGKVGFAVSHNDGAGGSGGVRIEDLTVYAVSA